MIFPKRKPILLSGRAVREAHMPELKSRIQALSTKLSASPTLAIIQAGDRPDSAAFIRAKRSFAEKVGVVVRHINVSENVPQSELIDIINECNSDTSVHGIIVQLPLPTGIDRDAVIDAIDPAKDADALTAVSVKRWMEGREDVIMPATARGIRTMLSHYQIELFGKKVCVVGRSTLVGKPVIAMCLNENATVTVCHSKTPNLAAETRTSDVIIVAAGKPGLIGSKHLKKDSVVIDVGINTVSGQKLDDEIEGDRLVGDVDFDAASKKAATITPVPGGVGPMTVFSLFENLADLCENHVH